MDWLTIGIERILPANRVGRYQRIARVIWEMRAKWTLGNLAGWSSVRSPARSQTARTAMRRHASQAHTVTPDDSQDMFELRQRCSSGRPRSEGFSVPIRCRAIPDKPVVA